MLKKRDILFISSWYPNVLHPTLGNFVERHAAAISSMHRVFVVHVVPDPSRVVPFFDYRKTGDLHVGILYHPAVRPHRLFRSRFFQLAYRRMQKTVAFTPELVHLNVLYPMGDVAAQFARKLNVPMVATEHWTGYHPNTHNSLSQRQWLKIRKVAAQCSLLCPVSEHLAAAMQSNGLDSEYRIIGNVVDTDVFTLPQQRAHAKRILHVSNLLDVHKNVSGILRSFRNALDLDPELHLTVIGDGDLTPHQSLAHELNLSTEQIRFQGTTPIEGIAKAMQEANALVLFSNYENLPCVIGEAFATGLPVISTRVGGIAEHLNASRGALLEANDEAALTKAMVTVVNNPYGYASEALRKYAVDHFSTEAIATAYNEVYLSVLSKHVQ